MKLKYIGLHSPIVIPSVKNEDGSIGISVSRWEIFDCDEEIAADLIKKFNTKSRKMFIFPSDEEKAEPKREYRRKIVDKIIEKGE